MGHLGFLSQDGIITNPPGVTFSNIRPGEVNTALVTLTNTHDTPMKVSGLLQKSGEIFEGVNPLIVRFDVTSGEVCPEEPNAVLPQGQVSIAVTGQLPSEAGNEYQLSTGQATYFFTASEITQEACFGSEIPKPTPTVSAPLPSGGGLSVTGASYSPTLTLGLILIISAAMVLSVRKLRKGRRCELRT